MQTAEQQLQTAEQRKAELELTRSAQTHPSDELRGTLRQLSAEIEDRKAISESQASVGEQQALRAELITAKMIVNSVVHAIGDVGATFRTPLVPNVIKDGAGLISTFSIRGTEREIATLVERITSLQWLQLMPEAINDLEREAGALQGDIDPLRTSLNEERARLQLADANIAAIAEGFKRIMIDVSFPGVSEEDEVASTHGIGSP